MKKLAILLLLISQITFSNNLNISNVNKISDNEMSFDISWDNSWKGGDYHDAVWIFVKAKDNSGNWQHVNITNAWGSGLSPSAIPSDQKGFFVKRSSFGSGSVSGTINFNFLNSNFGPFPDFKIFGIEMVYVNQGAFYIGDGVSFHRFGQGNDDTIPFHITSSDWIYHGSGANNINGSTDIRDTFPNGFLAFYAMKYELSQEQYVEFLNTLTPVQQQNRTKTDLSAITSSNRFVMSETSFPATRNAIACDDDATNTSSIEFYCDLNQNQTPNEINDGQNIACNKLSVDDTLAYLDWAALRPITELEYEKASRGFSVPVAGESANGTTLALSSSGIIYSGKADETVSNINSDGLINFSNSYPLRVGIFATSTSNRLKSGGSFFGIMDMSGNLYEYTIKLNTVFEGVRGDGVLDADGKSNQWIGVIGYIFMRGGNYQYTDYFTKTSIRFHGISSSNFDSRSSNGSFRGCR